MVQRRVGTSLFEAVLQGVFELAEVQYAHLRNAQAGCFIARIDRFRRARRAEERSTGITRELPGEVRIGKPLQRSRG
jgi:hypothetical protein